MIVRSASEALTVSEFFDLQEDALKAGLSLSIKKPEGAYDMTLEYLSDEHAQEAMRKATGGFMLSGLRNGHRTFFSLQEVSLFLDGYMAGSSRA